MRDLAGTLNPTTKIITTSIAEFNTHRHFFAYGQDFVARVETGPVKQKFLFGGDQRHDTQHTVTKTFMSTKTAFNYLVPNYDIYPTSATTAAPVVTDITSRTSGAYAQDQISVLKDRLTFVAGMRYNEFAQKSRTKTTVTNPATFTDGQKTISRYGVIVQPFDQDVTVYYNRSESFLFNGGVDYLNDR